MTTKETGVVRITRKGIYKLSKIFGATAVVSLISCFLVGLGFIWIGTYATQLYQTLGLLVAFTVVLALCAIVCYMSSTKFAEDILDVAPSAPSF